VQLYINLLDFELEKAIKVQPSAIDQGTEIETGRLIMVCGWTRYLAPSSSTAKSKGETIRSVTRRAVTHISFSQNYLSYHGKRREPLAE